MPASNPLEPTRLAFLSSIPWLAAGLGFEGWAAYRWVDDVSLPTLLQITLHSVGSLLLAEGVRLLLPTHYQRPALGIVLLFFLLLLLLPGIALLGLLLAVVPALYFAAPHHAAHWQALELPPLPYQPLTPPSPHSTAMREGLTSVLSYSRSPLQRQEAILACRHLPPRQTIDLLRLGLADPTDDVRLLAYSMLSSTERDLDERIQRLSHQLEQHSDPFGHHAEALAMLNWEYDYLKLAQGSTANFYLTQALTYIDQAISRANSAHRQLLRGRMCLALRDIAGAEAAFLQCETLGLDNDDLAPYRAELAFQTHRYSALREQLFKLSPTAQQHPIMYPLMEYWR
tara:strand:- start:73305 stop:74330 length:1026 start_codon:yes stop_codon:yes gene_type:complete